MTTGASGEVNRSENEHISRKNISKPHHRQARYPADERLLLPDTLLFWNSGQPVCGFAHPAPESTCGSAK